MATSIKIIKDNNKIDIITTEYNKDFTNHINRKGRNKHNFELIDDNQFKKCVYEKITRLKTYNKTLNYIKENNEFNYFLTIRGINKIALKKLIDRLKKADKDLSFVSLASWSISMDLHYHILLNISISETSIKRKLKDINYDLKEIYNKKKLFKYLKKNINFDTIYVLQQNNEEFKEKQIDILNYSKILSYSKNIKYKPTIIKNPNGDDLQEIYNNNKYLETIEYTKLSNKITIDKFEI